MNIENKFLLVCLQLIIVLLLMSVHVEGLADMRSRRRLLSDQALPPSPFFALSSTSPVARAYRLHNLRSKADVVMGKDNRVTATALNSDERGELGLESVMKDEAVRTRIRGLMSDRYLCFNHKGRLVSKPRGRARGAKCEFIEEMDLESGSSSFKSALHPGWRVGFNHKGYGLLGPSYGNSECLECFLFYKTSINTPSRKSPPPAHLTQRNFDLLRHNQRIGQIHPGLNPDFLSSFPLPRPQSARGLKIVVGKESNWRKISSKTASQPTRRPHQSARHRRRHRKKKHRHQHGKPRQRRRHQKDMPNAK